MRLYLSLPCICTTSFFHSPCANHHSWGHQSFSWPMRFSQDQRSQSHDGVSVLSLFSTWDMAHLQNRLIQAYSTCSLFVDFHMHNPSSLGWHAWSLFNSTHKSLSVLYRPFVLILCSCRPRRSDQDSGYRSGNVSNRPSSLSTRTVSTWSPKFDDVLGGRIWPWSDKSSFKFSVNV